MQKQISSQIIILTFGVLVLCFLAAFYVIAWTEPSAEPPGGNVETPLNTGSTNQEKAGNLSFPIFYDNPNSSYYVDPDGLSILAGPVGIGTLLPSTELHVEGNARITGLADCDTIDTDASGNLVCGTDAGGGGGDTFQWISAPTTQLALNNLGEDDDINWTDLDLTGATSPNAKAAFIEIQIEVEGCVPPWPGTKVEFAVRKNGTVANWYPNLTLFPEEVYADGGYYHLHTLVGLDNNQVLEYKVDIQPGWYIDAWLATLGYIE